MPSQLPPLPPPNRSKPQEIKLTRTPIPPGLSRTKSTVHLPLYRRILFPHDDPSSNIPKIINFDEGNEELEVINERLYNLIALALRAYVLSWYTRFSSERTFPSQINKNIIYPILSPILTSIYDDPDKICYLILIDLPTILNLHIKTFNESKLSQFFLPSSPSSLGKQQDEDLKFDLGRRYNNRLSLISIAETENETSVSQLWLENLSNSILNHFLQDKDNRPDVEKYMSREIISKSVLGNVIKRLVESWFWYQIILKLLGESKGQNEDKESIDKDKKQSQEYRSIDQLVLNSFNTLIKIFTSIWNLIIHIIALYSASKDYGPKYRKSYEPTLMLLREILQVDGNGLVRSTWVKRLSWGGVEMGVGLFGPILDRLLPHLIHTTLLTPKNSLKLIALIENILFPNGYPGPSPIDPTPQEVIILKEKVEKRLEEIIPNFIKSIFFSDSRGTSILLDFIENRNCNSHLIAMILGNLVATLIPDLVIEGNQEIPVGNEDDSEIIET